MAEAKKKKKGENETYLTLIMDKQIYEDIKSVAQRKRITVNQAFNEAGKLLVAEFDREIAEGLK